MHFEEVKKVNNETDKRNNLMDALDIVVAAVTALAMTTATVAAAATTNAELSAKASCGCVRFLLIFWCRGIYVYPLALRTQ